MAKKKERIVKLVLWVGDRKQMELGVGSFKGMSNAKKTYIKQGLTSLGAGYLALEKV